MKKISVAILGASGYTGAELVRLLLPHPYVRLALLTGETQAGKTMGEVYPHLRHQALPALVSIDQADFSSIDLVFCCLPHGTTQSVIAALPNHVRIIDLSADFRLSDPASYAKWYGHAHQAVELQKEAVYGLTEIARDAIRSARLVANPGCYPTSAQLPLIPLLTQGLIEKDDIIIDSKSGVTGAGRSAKQANLFCEVTDGMNAYGVASHRHSPEIEQGLSQAKGEAVAVTFTPHLIPMSRGILSTIYVKLAKGKSVSDIRAALQNAYDKEPFVHLLPEGSLPSTHHVKGTNQCLISVVADRHQGRAIIVSVIDNLVKGASGQAVQNMNVMYDWPETEGLALTAIFP
ncbi:MAG: N-acetyl-gamma-glutamyl-phosphate reductase [Rickettsiales bacterium]|nr:N-acetyl-gamma-glutamyl-phosphate reductase [Rickettsiales bacterium]